MRWWVWQRSRRRLARTSVTPCTTPQPTNPARPARPLTASSRTRISIAHIEPAAIRKDERDQQTGRGAIAARIDDERECAADLETALAVDAGAAQAGHTE